MTDGEAYVMFVLERLKVCGPKMAILGKEGPLSPRSRLNVEACASCEYCGGPSYACDPSCDVETIEQGVRR